MGGVLDSLLLPVGGTLTMTGIVGWMARLLVISERRATAAEARYTAEIKRINRDHDAEIKELRKARTDDIAELNKRVSELSKRVEDLHAKWDSERTLRHAAEDRAARAEQAGGLRSVDKG